MDALMNILQSAWFKAWVIAPMAVIGFFQIFRGITAVLVKDLTEKQWPHKWVIIAYIAITVLSCLCLVIAL